MKDIEKVISPLIQSQFPAFYNEEGPQFIAFVKAYYEWLESEGQPLYHSRRLNDYQDIDNTVDDFILYFKEKYLKNIEFDLASNKKLLVKNSLDLYRSKGTPRSVELFFRLVYGTDAEVRFPKDKIFKLSDGVWAKPTYLEVSETSRNVDYVGKIVTGVISGASAFVERFVKRQTAAGYVNILEISNINGEFRNGETLGVILADQDLTTYSDSPRLIGSLREIIVQDGSRNFKVGDIVNIESDFQGIGAQARVSAVTNATSAVDFLFIDGGWGYTNTSAFSIVSEKVLTLGGITVAPEACNYFSLFETFAEPIITLSVDNALDDINAGDFIYRYDISNTTQLAVGKVITANMNAANGILTVSALEGSFISSGNVYYTDSNVQFDVTGVSDRTIVGKVMSTPTNYEIFVNKQFGNIRVGDKVYQEDKLGVSATGIVAAITPTVSGNTITITSGTGAFKNSYSTYVPNDRTVQFNANTSVNPGTYFISIANNTLSNNDLVLYRTNDSNTAISGLANNETYFVINANTSGLNVSRIRGGTAIPLIPGASSSDTGHFFELANKNVFYARIAANSTSIDTVNNFIFVSGNELSDNDIVHYYTDTGNTAITGLANSSTYFVVSANTSGFKLATTYNGTPVPIAATANATGHNIQAIMSIKATTSTNVDIPDFRAELRDISFNAGVYEIRRSVYYVNITGASSNAIYDTSYVYAYSDDGFEVAKGRVVTADFDAAANSGLMSILPISGYFIDGTALYTEGNTASATISSYTVDVKGGDYVSSENSYVTGLLNGTSATILSQSSGFGAGFDIGFIGENEQIYIGTDILNSNSVSTVNFEKVSLGVSSNPGVAAGDIVYQTHTAAFHSGTGIDTNDFITTSSANIYANGDIVEYRTSTTPLQYQITTAPYSVGSPLTVSLANGDLFHVCYANTTGFKIRHTREGDGYLNLVPQSPGSTNHSFIKVVAGGTVTQANSSAIQVNDPYKTFVTTSGNYSNVIVYANSAVNVAVTAVGTLPSTITPARVYPVERVRATSYGFPKNPLGDFESTIFSCLTFGKFDIGTIGNIQNVDPGSDYNVDPYVLVYQPYIANFNRKDYIFHIEDATRSFAIGEKITQTPSSLSFYDLQVAGGVKDSSYNEISKNFNPVHDVSSASDFIYVPYLTVSVDANTAVDQLAISFDSLYNVDPVEKFISLDNQSLVDGDAIVYRAGSLTIGGLTSGTTYYVVQANSSGIKLADSTANTTPISVTRTTGSETHSFIKSLDNFITVPGNVYTNNMVVRYYTETSTTPITGLANNALYQVVNTTSYGFKLANSSNAQAIISVTPSATLNDTGHNIKAYYNGDNSSALIFSNDDSVVYNLYDSGTGIGLTNNEIYYVVQANTLGFKLSTIVGGAPEDLTATATAENGYYISTVPGYIPGDIVQQEIIISFDSSTNVSNTNEFIAVANNQLQDGDIVTYYTGTGGTSITGANNATYEIIQANTSGFKLSADSETAVNLTATGTSQTHFIKAVPTGYVTTVFTSGANSFVRVSNTSQTFAAGYYLTSTTYPSLDGFEVQDVTLYSQLKTAEGIIKAIDNSTLYVQRIDFENTFIEEETITGQFTGATAKIVRIEEDANSLPIGLNANVQANVVTANGVIRAIDVIDSGLSYANSELFTYTSEDGMRAGTGKAVLGGHGISKGYYKSSKGFLSNDIKVHDGDFYQEYSYEVLSKVSFDRYKDMFFKVMHLSGSKLFGSAMIIENVDTSVEVAGIQTVEQVEFNARTDVDTVTDTIDVGIPQVGKPFNPLRNDTSARRLYMPFHNFANDEYVQYYTAPGNTANFGLANNQYYYVSNTDSFSIQLTATEGGTPIALSSGNFERGHYIRKFVNPFANNDLVEYTVDLRTFNKKLDIDADADFIRIENNIFSNGQPARYITLNSTPVSGLVNNQVYYAYNANSSGMQLSTGEKILSAVFKYEPDTKNATVWLVDSRNYSVIDIAANTYGPSAPKVYSVSGGKIRIVGSDYTIEANNYEAKMIGPDGETVDILFSYNEDETPIGTLTMILGDTEYFSQTGTNNTTRYAYKEDTLNVYVPAPTRIDYHITDSDDLDGLLPDVDQGATVDLLVPEVEFGQSNINFTNDFITVRNINSTTGQLLFTNSTPATANVNKIRFTTRYKNVPIRGLFEGEDYYVVQANSTGFKISNTANGTPIDIYKETESFSAVTNVSDDYNFIVIRDNEFVVDDKLLYVSNTGYRTITGLSNNSYYYVTFANNVGVRLSETPRGPVIDIKPALVHTVTFDSFNNVANTTDFISVNNFTYTTGANTIQLDKNTSITNATSLITVSEHTLVNNDLVQYVTSPGNTAITRLVNNDIYYVISANSTTFKVSNTSGGAAVAIVSGTSETGHFFVPVELKYRTGETVLYTSNTRTTAISGLSNNTLYNVFAANTTGFKLTSNGTGAIDITSTKTRLTSFNSVSNVSSATDFITISHTFQTGDYVRYYTNGTSGSTIIGLANNTNYYIVDANTSGVKLSSTSGGSALAINAASVSATSYIEAVTANTQTITTANTINKNHFERQLSDNGYVFTLINNENGSGQYLYKRTPLPGFENEQQFYVVDTNGTLVGLSNTVGGNKVALAIGPNETGHYLRKITED